MKPVLTWAVALYVLVMGTIFITILVRALPT